MKSAQENLQNLAILSKMNRFNYKYYRFMSLEEISMLGTATEILDDVFG